MAQFVGDERQAVVAPLLLGFRGFLPRPHAIDQPADEHRLAEEECGLERHGQVTTRELLDGFDEEQRTDGRAERGREDARAEAAPERERRGHRTEQQQRGFGAEQRHQREPNDRGKRHRDDGGAEVRHEVAPRNAGPDTAREAGQS